MIAFDALFRINEKGIIQQTTSACTRVFGWAEEEFIGSFALFVMLSF